MQRIYDYKTILAAMLVIASLALTQGCSEDESPGQITSTPLTTITIKLIRKEPYATYNAHTYYAIACKDERTGKIWVFHDLRPKNYPQLAVAREGDLAEISYSGSDSLASFKIIWSTPARPVEKPPPAAK